MMNPSPCPFCNAPLPPLAATPAADKLPCPRCGELVPAARWVVDAALQSVREGSPRPYAQTAKAEAAPRNRKTMLVLLGIMLTMAFLSLSYMLWTQGIRRSRDPHITKHLAPIGQRRPLELVGLGYLPKDVSLIAGLHVAEMVADKEAGSKLLAKPRPAYVGWVFEQIAGMTGLDADGLDHVVVGVTFDTSPQLVMVMATRAPVDLARVAKSTKPHPSRLYKGKPLYVYSVDPIGEALLWCVEERTLVAVFRLDQPTPAHLDALAPEPLPAREVLPAQTYGVLKERLRTHQFAWAAGRLDKLGVFRAFLPPNLRPVKDINTFALGIEPTAGLTLTGNFLMTDAKSAARYKDFLENVKIDGAKTQKVEMTAEDAEEQWVTWQVRGDADTFRDFLNRGKERKKER